MLVNPCKSSLAAVGFSLFIFFVYPGSLGAGANGHAESFDFNLPQWPVLRMFNARRSLWKELPQDLVKLRWCSRADCRSRRRYSDRFKQVFKYGFYCG